MPANLSGPTLIVILFIVLLLFGAPKLPALAKSLGQSMKILKKEVGPSETDKAEAEAAVQAEPVLSVEEQLAAAKAEAEAAKAEAEALRQKAAREAQDAQIAQPTQMPAPIELGQSTLTPSAEEAKN